MKMLGKRAKSDEEEPEQEGPKVLNKPKRFRAEPAVLLPIYAKDSDFINPVAQEPFLPNSQLESKVLPFKTNDHCSKCKQCKLDPFIPITEGELIECEGCPIVYHIECAGL